MGEYQVNMYRIDRYKDGHESTSQGFTKFFNERQVKHIKQVNKQVGYKYLGRFNDRYNNAYSLYERKDEKLSNSEYEVIYRVKIFKFS